jgi:hypothetical protein
MADLLANKAMQDRHSSTASTAWTATDEQLVDMIPADTSSPLTPSRADRPTTYYATQQEPSNDAPTQHPINPPTGVLTGGSQW